MLQLNIIVRFLYCFLFNRGNSFFINQWHAIRDSGNNTEKKEDNNKSAIIVYRIDGTRKIKTDTIIFTYRKKNFFLKMADLPRKNVERGLMRNSFRQSCGLSLTKANINN